MLNKSFRFKAKLILPTKFLIFYFCAQTYTLFLENLKTTPYTFKFTKLITCLADIPTPLYVPSNTSPPSVV